MERIEAAKSEKLSAWTENWWIVLVNLNKLNWKIVILVLGEGTVCYGSVFMDLQDGVTSEFNNWRSFGKFSKPIKNRWDEPFRGFPSLGIWGIVGDYLETSQDLGFHSQKVCFALSRVTRNNHKHLEKLHKNLHHQVEAPMIFFSISRGSQWVPSQISKTCFIGLILAS